MGTDNKSPLSAKIAKEENEKFLEDAIRLIDANSDKDHMDFRFIVAELAGIHSGLRKFYLSSKVPEIIPENDSALKNITDMIEYISEFGSMLRLQRDLMIEKDKKAKRDPDEYCLASLSLVLPMSNKNLCKKCPLPIKDGFYVLRLVLDPENGSIVSEYSGYNFLYKDNNNEWTITTNPNIRDVPLFAYVDDFVSELWKEYNKCEDQENTKPDNKVQYAGA